MNKNIAFSFLIGFICSQSYAATNGTYAIQDGYYSINAEFEGDSLIVKEPNRAHPEICVTDV